MKCLRLYTSRRFRLSRAVHRRWTRRVTHLVGPGTVPLAVSSSAVRAEEAHVPCVQREGAGTPAPAPRPTRPGGRRAARPPTRATSKGAHERAVSPRRRPEPEWDPGRPRRCRERRAHHPRRRTETPWHGHLRHPDGNPFACSRSQLYTKGRVGTQSGQGTKGLAATWSSHVSNSALFSIRPTLWSAASVSAGIIEPGGSACCPADPRGLRWVVGRTRPSAARRRGKL